nr:replication associated protein [Flumine microvirus 17]
MEKSRQWAMRCMDEASLYSENCFVTLTYDEKHLPSNRSLSKREFQLFLKRLRKFLGRDRLDSEPLRYFGCGEYGPENGRPHYHILLFNVSFPDRVYLKTTASGEKIFRSPSLEKVWKFGFSSVGDVTFKSAAYVARYNLKKVNGVVGKSDYFVRSSGEVLEKEFVEMSRGSRKRGTGGIGRAWIEKFRSDVFPRGVRVIKGLDTPSCRFYDLQYEKVDPVGFARLKSLRSDRRVASALDNTPRRLLDKEVVKMSQIKILSTAKEV